MGPRGWGLCLLLLLPAAYGAAAARGLGGRMEPFGAGLTLLGRRRAVAGVGAGAIAVVASTRRLRRAVRFQAGMAAIGGKYARGFILTRGASPERQQAELERIDEETAHDILHLVTTMRGAYIKSAQLISTAFPDIIPQPWVAKLETLTDDAPPRPWAETQKILESELGPRWGESFRTFGERPIGAASVGQVHKAVLADGRSVCVKVMYPGVERQMMADLANVRRVLRIAKPALLPAVDEFKERVQHEFDYEAEALKMERVRLYVAKRRLPKVKVPKAVLELTTQRVMTMEWLDGKSLSETVQRRYNAITQSTWPVLRPLQLSRLKRSTLLALRRTAKAQGCMIFGDGAFSCDPHPGNVLLVGGAVGLIDYGCFATFNDEQRVNVAKLYVALAQRDEDAIVDAMRVIGFRSRKNDKDFIVAFATQCFDRDLSGACMTSPYSLLKKLESQDRLLTIPKTYMLVARVSLLLRGLASKCGSDLSIATVWHAEAQAVVDEDMRRRAALKAPAVETTALESV